MKKISIMLRTWCSLLIVSLVINLVGCDNQSPMKPESQSESESIPAYLYQGDFVADLPGGSKMAFVLIEPGTFIMGGASRFSGVPSFEDEAPQHMVILTKKFYLGKYEVTRGQWESVMGKEALPEALENASQVIAPVVNVSWNDCQTFINRLNQTGGEGIYRLPTEAEWEYACRAGTSTPWYYGFPDAGLEFHGPYVWYEGNSSGYPHDVGLKKPNAWGLYDMLGNVAEWVQDRFAAYTTDSQIDPQGPDEPLFPSPHFDRRSIRGGSFKTELPLDFRSAIRNGGISENKVESVGFRIVREMP